MSEVQTIYEWCGKKLVWRIRPDPCSLAAPITVSQNDISLDLDSSMDFNATGNSSAAIDIKVSVKNVAQAMQGIQASSVPTGCAGAGTSSALPRPITSLGPITSSTLSVPRSSGFPQSGDPEQKGTTHGVA
ncbi:hypothetical protein B0H14DRAFT_3141859 [Mycena olivaceomarginata]|nr:hypothetical protein B0H14DRAFT_3141859 [Mycena olivaceomarginata]